MLPTTMRPTTTKAGRLRLIALATLFFTVPNAEAASAPAIDPNEAVGQLMTCIVSRPSLMLLHDRRRLVTNKTPH